MNKLFFIVAISTITQMVQAQYCSQIGPSSAIDSNIESVTLNGDTGGISFAGTCPGIIGLQVETGLTTTLSAGSNYTTSIQFGTCGGNYSGLGEAWIDFNGNQTFEPNESIGTWSGLPPVAISTFSFNVPPTIYNGQTRMRVMQREGGNLPLDPCGSYSWGSVVDFSVTLTGGIDCSPYIGNTTADPIIVSSLPYTNNHDNSICYTNNNPAYASVDVFYLILPPANSSSISVSLCGSSFDTFLSVFDTDGNTITFNDDGSCGSQSEVTFSTIGLDSAYVVVEGWGTEYGAYTIQVNETPLGLNNNSALSHQIYPNPTQSYFKIKNLNTELINILDITGKTIKTISNYTGQNISIEELKNGLYFINYKTNGLSYTKKIIKK